MKWSERIVIAFLILGALAFIHGVYLYFWVYGDVVHSHLTPNQWVKMYGFNIGFILIARAIVGIMEANSK